MQRLGRVIVEAVVHHYGRDELLRRLAQPFWFQCFGAVMGMDWHSSGITTSVLGALQRGLRPVERELGLSLCGGKGARSRETPQQLLQVAERCGLDGDGLTRTSRLIAKVDSAAVQDGFGLYLHVFIVAADGKWCVVQQGMDTQRREARRYHWLSEGVKEFLDSPHSAIDGRNVGAIVNLADIRAERNRRASLALLAEGPDRLMPLLRRPSSGNAALSLFPELEPQTVPLRADPRAPHLQLPAHHDVRASDVVLKRLHATLAAAADRGPKDFAELLLVPGVGPRTVASLAHVAEVIHGAPCRFTDPARYSLAHGGKDRHPFPVPLKVYDRTITVLKQAIASARLGNDDRLAAIRRLDEQARGLEGAVSGPGLHEFVAREWADSPAFDGRSV